MSLEGATKCQRPGNTHAAYDAARGGTLCTADETYQCRFTGAVAAENTKVLTTSQSKADVVQHLASPLPCRVHLRDVFYGEHLEFHPPVRLVHNVQSGEREAETAHCHVPDIVVRLYHSAEIALAKHFYAMHHRQDQYGLLHADRQPIDHEGRTRHREKQIRRRMP